MCWDLKKYTDRKQEVSAGVNIPTGGGVERKRWDTKQMFGLHVPQTPE